MAFGYVTQAVLNRIAEKTASLVNAVKTIATNAETLAQTASAEAKFNGTCATAAATAAKVVVCAEYTQLSVGSRITVKFTYANTAATATLNVNSTGAKSIVWGGSTSVASSWAAGETCLFAYDGTNWVLLKAVTDVAWSDISGANPISKGGTGATTAAQALTNLGAAADDHTHTITDLNGTLSIAKGGTGATTASGALANLGAAASGHTHALTASSITGTLPISKGGTGATTAAAARTALGCATRAYYTASVNTTWSTNSSGGYYKTVSISGILATDVPVVGVVLSSDVSAATLQGQAFACVNRITTAANSITLYAFKTKPTTAFTLQLLVIR